MELVLGVDAGGTSTRAILATVSGEVLGRGTAGPGNPIAAGNQAAAEALATAVRTALSGHDPSDVTGAALGLAGWSRLRDVDAASAYAIRWAELGLTCRMRAYPDAVTAFTAATPSPNGSVLIAGTGAVAARIASWRITATADGLGWLLGDEGSGTWLGLQAVRTAARTWSRASFVQPSPPLPALVALVAGHAAAATADALIDWAHQVPRKELAALAPVICSAADAGDTDCAAIVAEASARLVATLDELGPPAGPVVLAGGLLTADTAVRRAVINVLRRRATPPLTVGDAAIGAAWLAARAAARLDGPQGTAVHAALLASTADGCETG